MTEQNTNPPTTPDAPPVGTVEAAQTKAKPAKEAEKKVRYAAYDTTYLHFVGDVCDSATAARKEARDRKVKDFEIREV